MIVSGENFRSLAERNEVSFAANLSFNNATGSAEFGFSGSSEGFKFQFLEGRVLDPEGRYFNSYGSNQEFALSGNLETGKYDYYIDGDLNCSIGKKNDIKFNKFFVNTYGCSLDLGLNVFSTPQDYSLSYKVAGVNSNIILNNLTNNQAEEFVVFTGTLTDIEHAGTIELDTDVPSGVHDGTYIQDYKYYVGSGDLDECNGISGVTPEYPSGIYHYHVTDNWPYVMACFKGEPATQVSSLTETVSGTAPAGTPTPWLTGKFFDRQTRAEQTDDTRHYTSGVNVQYSDDYVYINSKGIPRNLYGEPTTNCECRPFAWSTDYQPYDWWQCYKRAEDGNLKLYWPADLEDAPHWWGRQSCESNCCNIKQTPDGLPIYEWGNTTSQQDHLFRIPINPKENTAPLPLPMRKIGVAIDGVPIDTLSDEYYKDRGRWRKTVHPGAFHLDKNGAHVQPDGTYHYHTSPSGVICDYNFTTPSISVVDPPEDYSNFIGLGFTKYANVFGVNIFATSGVSNSKVLHAANVMAEYMDNDLDGKPDNVDVANSLVCNQASLIMSSGELKIENMSFVDEGVSGIDLSRLSGVYALQPLQGIETNPTGIGEFDSSLEKVLHLLTNYGWSEAYPDTLGTLHGSTLTNYMNSGRGGHFEWCDEHQMSDGTLMWGSIHGQNQKCLNWGAVLDQYSFFDGKANGSYPSGSWFHNEDRNYFPTLDGGSLELGCDYSCQASKYLYWGITTILGAQTGRYAEVSKEWEYVTPTGLQSGDPNFYNLLIDTKYKLPTGYLPTGSYNPSATTTVYANTGHSPLIGYAFDGYPIYGPMGYVDPLVSGEIKEMKSSYLPKNTDRGPAYPKTIKQYNDLYLPYGIDLISDEDIGETNLNLVLHTNFGDFEHPISIGGLPLGETPPPTAAQSSSQGTQIY